MIYEKLAGYTTTSRQLIAYCPHPYLGCRTLSSMAPKQTPKQKPKAIESNSEDEIETPALDSEKLRMSYQIARGEMGVLTFEPYKSMLLPYWRFRTPDIASKSSQDLWSKFVQFGKKGDFVGMDMTRKFIQMGMTRAKRYANHKGGKKYEAKAGEDGTRKQLPKSEGHKDKEEKEEASRIFKETWQKCKEDETYIDLKEKFQAEQKEWKKNHVEN